MKIAIHNTDTGFHKNWRKYCIENEIDYKDVNCYADDILEQLADCDALMWHFWQTSSKDFLRAKRLLFSLDHSGFSVFPNFKTCWHFDDKIAQKFLLEALDLPLVKSFNFLNKNDALEWAKRTTFPKVFKLKGGAGSLNVQLVKNKSEAISLINKSFSRGFNQYDKFSALKERIRKYRKREESFIGVLKSVYRIFNEPQYSKVLGRVRSEVYFQEFIPDNNYDIRVIVIDNKAFAIKRMVRDNDFRASGSGVILFEKEHFNDELIRLSFECADKLDMQCCAFDFVFVNNEAKIVEISYGYAVDAYNKCVGYWDKNLCFHEGNFDSTNWMVDAIKREINLKNA